MNTITCNWIILIAVVLKWLVIAICTYAIIKLALFGIYKLVCHGKLSLRAWWKRSKI